jgi:hypothetical protein
MIGDEDVVAVQVLLMIRDCSKIGSGALSVVVLSEDDAVTQEVDAGSAVRLSFEQLGFGVPAFGASVVVLEGWPSGGRVDRASGAQAFADTAGAAARR